MPLRFELIWFLVSSYFISCDGKFAFISLSENAFQVNLTDNIEDIPNVHIARATYNNAINTTGWATLEIHSSAAATDIEQAYGAGYIEGFLTHDLIWMHWQNTLQGYCMNKTKVCDLIQQFLDKNEEYIELMIESELNDPYWYQMKLYYIQLQGLSDGYNEATKDQTHSLSYRDIIWLNMLGDLDELAYAVSMPPDGSPSPSDDVLLFPSHCSGLVKLLPDRSNLYVAHATWNSYQSMLRIQKMYVLQFRLCPTCKSRIPGRQMSLSSYPGAVQSTDDFYIIESGLVAAETTIGNSNRTLFRMVKPRGQILEYARAMVACRLARSGQEWVDTFRKHNSGTYNNAWYIVDYKRFAAPSVKSGLLWVLEQLPGYTESKDITQQLVSKTYFPSYNIPMFPAVFNMSGGNERVAAHGRWFSYDDNPRAHMFREKQSSVRNLRDMFMAMRYNNYKHDRWARCDCHPPYSASNAIAARSDLNPADGKYPFPTLGHRSHGATDAKVTSATLRKTYQFLAVSSPTHNVSRGIPPFKWSTFDLGNQVPHVGHPDAWAFSPLLHQWQWG